MLGKKLGSARKPRNKAEKAEKIKKTLTLIGKAVNKGMSYADSARLAGIHPQTFWDWKKFAREGREPYAEYWDIIVKAELEGEMTLLERIDQAGVNGDWRADAWLLEKRKPKRYGKREHINQTVIDKRKKDLSKMSDDELEDHIEELEKAKKGANDEM